MMKFAANLSMMFQECGGLLNRYEAAAKAGFRYVECAFPYVEHVDAIKSVKDKLALEQVLINTPVGVEHDDDKGFACLPHKLVEFRSSIQLAIEYAVVLKCPRIHVMAGKTPIDISFEVAEKTYIDNLRYAATEFQKHELMCLIEPINPISIPGYFLNNYDKALAYLNLIKQPNLKLQLDIFHLQMISGNLSNNIKRLLPYTGHIQIAQAPDRHEPDSDGEMNYRFIFDLLKSLNYDQSIGCEYIPQTDTVSGLKWMTNFNVTL